DEEGDRYRYSEHLICLVKQEILDERLNKFRLLSIEQHRRDFEEFLKNFRETKLSHLDEADDLIYSAIAAKRMYPRLTALLEAIPTKEAWEKALRTGTQDNS